MRKWVKDILLSLLLVGIAVLCIVRWQAWFGMPEEPFWAEPTIDYTFPEITPLQSSIINDSDSCLTLLVLGDIHNNLTAEDYNAIAAREPEIDAIMQVGDWLQRGQNYYYQSLLREWTQCDLYGTPVIACPGNHEYSKGLNKTLSPVWENAFPHPHNGPVNVPGASYYIDLPQVRFIVIDTNPLIRMPHLTRTLTWLRSLMKTADDRFVVVLMHHPVLSPGKGRFNPLEYSFFRYALSQTDLVLAGHDHSYMRRTPFVVLNTAGKPKALKQQLKADTTFTEPVYGVLTIEPKSFIYHQSSMSFRVYRLDNGEMIDSLYVQHD